MLPRHAPERALNVLQSITRQLTLVLILDLNSHCSSVSQPDDYAQQRLSTLREVSVLRQTDCSQCEVGLVFARPLPRLKRAQIGIPKRSLTGHFSSTVA